MTIAVDIEADRALKAKHRAIWASGDYPRVASELVHDLGAIAVAAAGITAGQRVLDVGAGTGNASIPAAQAGARVVASDLTPELLEVGRRRADEAGVTLDWIPADAEALPFEDNEFDTVISVIGAMFAPHHRPTADEMIRVCKPGGAITMINWTPQGVIGQLFKTMGPYAPTPPPGAQPPPLWGDEDHVRSLFGSRVTGLRMRRNAISTPPQLDSPTAVREYFKTNYGPTIAVYKSLAEQPDRMAALDQDFLDLFARTDSIGPGARGRWDMEYLVVTARRV